MTDIKENTSGQGVSMYRQIKFRAISLQTYETNIDGVLEGEFVYGYYRYDRSTQYGVMLIELEKESGGIGSGIVQIPIDINRKTLGQFTGLKDKNGVEIYEGDIIRYRPNGYNKRIKSKVEYSNESGVMGYIFKYKWGWDYISSYCEVIGNIYQNK